MNMKNVAIIWLIISFIFIGSFIFFISSGPYVVRAGFFMKLLSVFAGTIAGFIGAMVGDLIRRFALPDAIFTTGGLSSIVGTKLF